MFSFSGGEGHERAVWCLSRRLFRGKRLFSGGERHEKAPTCPSPHRQRHTRNIARHIEPNPTSLSAVESQQGAAEGRDTRGRGHPRPRGRGARWIQVIWRQETCFLAPNDVGDTGRVRSEAQRNGVPRAPCPPPRQRSKIPPSTAPKKQDSTLRRFQVKAKNPSKNLDKP